MSIPSSDSRADPAVAALPVVRARGADGRLLRKTAVELVLDELRARILSGQIPPGAALRQEALADELGVSRIPLREAIRLLSSEGLVDVVPHSGAYVSMLSLDEVQEFFDLRQRLEPWLLHEAVGQIDDAALDAAESIVATMDTVGVEHWGELNWQLHELLYRPAGRPAAVSIVRALHEKSERYFRFQVVNAPIRQQSHVEHMALIALCRHRQADEAQLALEQHIRNAAEQILGIVGKLLADAQPNRAD